MRVLVTRRDTATMLMLGALAACARSSDSRAPAGDHGGPVTINWLASTITNRHEEPRQALKDAFQRAYPSISVELVSAPTNTDETRSLLRERIRGGKAGEAPDVYLGDVIWPAEFAEDELARPLDGLFPATFWSRFSEELVTAASFDGKTYAVPFYVDQGVLLYRKDLLARENLPNPPRTWEELERSARILLDKGSVDHGFVWQGARYEGLTCVLTEFAAAVGKSASEPPWGNDARPQVDTPQARKALGFMRRLLDEGISPPAVTGFREAQAVQAFDPGQSRGAAFQRAWNSAYFDVAELSGMRIEDKVGIAPLPVFEEGQEKGVSTIGGWSLYVNPRTKRNLPQVVKFIEWMTALPAQLTLAQYFVIPTNERARADSAVRRNPVLAAATEARPVRRPSATPRYRQVSEIIYSEAHRALLSDVDPDTALREAQRKIDGIPT